MKNRSILLTALMVALLASSGSFHASAAGETKAVARTAIAEAENLVLSCYEVTLEAEKSGTNITRFSNALNDAGILLSMANLAYENGSFTSAVYFANQTRKSLEGFINRVQTAKETSLQQNRWDFMINIAAPIIGSMAVVVGSFIVWSFLKKKLGSVST
jgi:hypothetical protein